jgi:hypothetical protein
MRSLFLLLVLVSLLVSCSMSKTEMLQDGPWVVESASLEGFEFAPQGTQWYFLENGVFRQMDPNAGTTEGTYTFNEETNNLLLNISFNGLSANIDLTLSALDEDLMVGSGPLSALGFPVGTVTVEASRP